MVLPSAQSPVQKSTLSLPFPPRLRFLTASSRVPLKAVRQAPATRLAPASRPQGARFRFVTRRRRQLARFLNRRLLWLLPLAGAREMRREANAGADGTVRR